MITEFQLEEKKIKRLAKSGHKLCPIYDTGPYPKQQNSNLWLSHTAFRNVTVLFELDVQNDRGSIKILN